MSQESKENIDKPKMDSLEDLLKKLDSSDDEEENDLSEAERLDAMMEDLVDEEEYITSDEE